MTLTLSPPKRVKIKVMETLTQHERTRQGRKPHPSAGSVDSQSVKTATQTQAKGSMLEKESMAASGMPWSTPWG